MARLIWTEPALSDLDAIADYIALDNPQAARALVRRIYRHVGQLARYPNSGTRIPEFDSPANRQLIEPPCRVLHRIGADTVHVLHVMRTERLLRPEWLRSLPD